MKPALAACAALVLAACATNPPPNDPLAGRRITYACDRGAEVTIVFAGDTAKVETADGAVTLQRRPSASGFWYEAATRTVRGKGDEIQYTIGRMVPMTCKVR